MKGQIVSYKEMAYILLETAFQIFSLSLSLSLSQRGVHTHVLAQACVCSARDSFLLLF